MAEDITEDDLDSSYSITLVSDENIFNSKNYKVLNKGIETDDILQGWLCDFLYTIVTLCEFPDNILNDNQNNIIAANTNNESNCTIQVILKKGQYMILIIDMLKMIYINIIYLIILNILNSNWRILRKCKSSSSKRKFIHYTYNYLSSQNYLGGKIY